MTQETSEAFNTWLKAQQEFADSLQGIDGPQLKPTQQHIIDIIERLTHERDELKLQVAQRDGQIMLQQYKLNQQWIGLICLGTALAFSMAGYFLF